MSYAFKPEEITVSNFQTQKVGGWSINGTNGIKLTYLPTGKVFTCEEHRSQHRNRAACIEMLEDYLNSLPSFKETLDKATKAGKVVGVPDDVQTKEDFLNWIRGEE